MTCAVSVIGSDFLKAAQQEDDEYMDRMRAILCTRGPSGGGSMQEPAMILDHLYLGNMNNARDSRLLKRIHITHVLNCAGKPRDYSQQPVDRASGPYDPEKTGVMKYHQFEACDSFEYPILMHYPQARAFIDSAKTGGGRVLVHCEMGVNRSAALCVAYLLEQSKMTLMQALRLIKFERPVLLVNDGFRRQLFEFAKERRLLHKTQVVKIQDDGQ